MLEPKQTSVPARKNQKDFLAKSYSIANTKGARSCEETKQKRYTGNALQSISFQKWYSLEANIVVMETNYCLRVIWFVHWNPS